MRKDLDIHEHERLSNITQIKVKKQRLYIFNLKNTAKPLTFFHSMRTAY
jgi:hypothetical protein